MLLRSTGLAQTLDLVIYDLVTSQRSEGSGQDQPITLVGIEESDIQRFGWPIDDGIFLQRRCAQCRRRLRDRLRHLQRPGGKKQQCLRDRFRDEPTLVSIFNVAAGIAAVPGTPMERQSYNDLSLDADGVVRRDLVHVTGQDEATVAFPLRVLEVATGDRSLRDVLNSGTNQGPWLSKNGGGYHNEIDAGLGLQRLLRFRVPGSYATYTLAEIIDGAVPEDMIRDRVVLIGSTAPSLRDLFEVPHTRFNRDESLFTISGVEVHANRLATLMDERNGHLQPGWLMPGWGNLLLVIGFASTGLVLGSGSLNNA